MVSAGGTDFFDPKIYFVDEWNAVEKLDGFRAQAIVLAIEHGNEKRINELTPYSNEKQGEGSGEHREKL